MGRERDSRLLAANGSSRRSFLPANVASPAFSAHQVCSIVCTAQMKAQFATLRQVTVGYIVNNKHSRWSATSDYPGNVKFRGNARIKAIVVERFITAAF